MVVFKPHQTVCLNQNDGLAASSSVVDRIGRPMTPMTPMATGRPRASQGVPAAVAKEQKENQGYDEHDELQRQNPPQDASAAKLAGLADVC